MATFYPPQPPPPPGTPSAPPVKKQRSSQTPQQHRDKLSIDADEAIARRRAELERLRQQRMGGKMTPSTTDLLARAVQSLQSSSTGNGEIPPGAQHQGKGPVPPAVPPREAPPSRVRHSDIFPSVTKPVESNSTRAPPPPRRLNDAFDGKPTETRSKSAPPVRPPPPPIAPPKVPTTAEASSTAGHKNRTEPTPTSSVQFMSPKEPLQKERIPNFKTPKVETPEMETLLPTRNNARHTPFPSKKDPPQEETPEPLQQSFAGRTPFPGKHRAEEEEPPAKQQYAGHTPFHGHYDTTEGETPTPVGKQSFAGQTPYAAKPGSHTPSSVKPSPTEPPSTVRREHLLHMREFADTPPSIKEIPSPVESPELRQQKQLLRLETEKADALRRVTQLESELQRLRESKAELSSVIEIAESEGEEAAMQWAREQVTVGKQQVGFLSPLVALVGSPRRSVGRINPMQQSVVSPQRKRSELPKPQRDTGPDDHDYMLQAIACVQHVYLSQGATFIIRRPYGLEDDHDLWFSAGQLTNKQYEAKADIHKSSTLEVVATIKADGSTLTVYGDVCACHRNRPDNEDKDFGNINERERPLGSVTYIDGDANEREYNLDEIFEEADSVRFSYSMSIISAADGLRRSNVNKVVHSVPATNGVTPSVHEVTIPKKPTSEIAIQTENNVIAPPEKKTQAPAIPPAEALTKKPQSTPQDQSSDILASLIGMLVSFVTNLLWTIFFTVPVKIISTAFYLVVAIAILTLLKAYISGYHGATTMMGAQVDIMYNRPGIV